MFERAPHPAPEAAAVAVPAPVWLWADRHPLAAALEATAPGPRLAERLAGLVAADLDDAALVEGVAAWERVASWVASSQATLLAEMGRRAVGSDVEWVPDEVAARLAITRRAAENRYHLAMALDAAPEVQDALALGHLEVRKVDVLLHETEHLSTSVRDLVRLAVLPAAPTLTVPQIKAAVRRAEITMDAAAAASRHEAARAERCVRLRPAPDAMAWVSALLPAPAATTAMTALDALAASSAPEDERGVDARRADALVDVMRDVLDTGIGPGGALPTTQRRHPHLSLTVNATTMAGLDEHPAELAGYGPIPAPVAREIAARAAWRAVGADPSTGEMAARSTRVYRPGAQLVGLVVDRDATCTFPGCRISATRCDVDHIEPYDHGANGDSPERTTVDNLHALCRHHHRLKTSGRWTPDRDPVTGVTTWRSSTGRTYTRDPHPIDPSVHEPVPRRPPRPTVDPHAHLPAIPRSLRMRLSGEPTSESAASDDPAVDKPQGDPGSSDGPPDEPSF